MAKRNLIRITYNVDGGLLGCVEHGVRHFLESAGYEFQSSGFDLKTHEREIVFEEKSGQKEEKTQA